MPYKVPKVPTPRVHPGNGHEVADGVTSEAKQMCLDRGPVLIDGEPVLMDGREGPTRAGALVEQVGDEGAHQVPCPMKELLPVGALQTRGSVHSPTQRASRGPSPRRGTSPRFRPRLSPTPWDRNNVRQRSHQRAARGAPWRSPP